MPTPAVPELAAVVWRRPPVGRVRLVCVDGYSGAGKTQLAGALAAALGGAPVVHLDDIYPGWDGLAAAIPVAVRAVAEPLVAGRVGRWRRHDWEADRPGEWCEVAPADVVLLEGCGAGAAPLRAFASTMIWVDAAPEVRARRLRARADWAGYAPHLRRWEAQEDALRAVDRTREHADVVVDNGS